MQESDSNRDRQIVVNPAVGRDHASPPQLQRVNHVLHVGAEVKPPRSEGRANPEGPSASQRTAVALERISASPDQYGSGEKMSRRGIPDSADFHQGTQAECMHHPVAGWQNRCVTCAGFFNPHLDPRSGVTELQRHDAMERMGCPDSSYQPGDSETLAKNDLPGFSVWKHHRSSLRGAGVDAGAEYQVGSNLGSGRCADDKGCEKQKNCAGAAHPVA